MDDTGAFGAIGALRGIHPEEMSVLLSTSTVRLPLIEGCRNPIHAAAAVMAQSRLPSQIGRVAPLYSSVLSFCHSSAIPLFLNSLVIHSYTFSILVDIM